MRSKILVAAAVVALGFFAIASGSALAAPGGKGGGGGKGGKPGTTSSAKLVLVSGSSATVCPIPCTAKVHGTGFTPGSIVSVGMVGDIIWSLVVADSTGAFDYTYPTTLVWVGTYSIGANSSDGKSASTTFSVR